MNTPTPYKITICGVVCRRDGNPLEPKDIHEIKRIAKKAGVKPYKDRILGWRVPGYALGGGENHALEAAFNGEDNHANDPAPSLF